MIKEGFVSLNPLFTIILRIIGHELIEDIIHESFLRRKEQREFVYTILNGF